MGEVGLDWLKSASPACSGVAMLTSNTERKPDIILKMILGAGQRL